MTHSPVEPSFEKIGPFPVLDLDAFITDMEVFGLKPDKEYLYYPSDNGETVFAVVWRENDALIYTSAHPTLASAGFEISIEIADYLARNHLPSGAYLDYIRVGWDPETLAVGGWRERYNSFGETIESVNLRSY